MKTPIFISVIFLLFGCGSPAQIESKSGQQNSILDSKDFVSKINEIVALEEKIHKDFFNGFVVVLCHEQSPIVYSKGFKNPVTKDSVLTTSDIFQLASCSKFFTGLAVLHLLKEYNLNHDDSIGLWFPEFKPALGKVTIRQLANHTCAIHDYLSLVTTPHLYANDDVIGLLSELDTTVYEPGSHWGYTNSGYVILSSLIERVSGIKYNTYLRMNVLKSLSMENIQLIPEKSTGLQGYIGMTQDTICDMTTGGHGIYVSTEDLISFFKSRHNLEKEFAMAKELASPWTDPSWTYGFGWFYSSDSIGEFRAHAGTGSGFQSYIRIYENSELMIFFLSNKEDELVRPIREQVITLLNKEITN